MSDVIQTVSVTCNGLAVRSCSFGTKVNGEIEWSVVMRKSLLDPATVDELDTFTLVVSVEERDGATNALLDSYTWTSPLLVAPDPDETIGLGGGWVSLHGTDYQSYLLSATGLSISTSHHQMASALFDAIATLAGASVTPLPDTFDWRVEDFEIVPDEPVGSGIPRLCSDAGLVWRIAQGGGIQIFNFESPPASAHGVRYAGGKRSRRNSARFKQAVLRKSSKVKAIYEFPINVVRETVMTGELDPGLEVASLHALDLSSAGRVQYAAFFAGPGGGGGLCGFIALEPGVFPVTITSSGPALSVGFKVLDPTPPMTAVTGSLQITGRAPGPYSYDPAVERKYPASITGRSKPFKVESSLWDTATTMDARAPQILAAANVEVDVVDFDAIWFNPRLWAGDTSTANDLPGFRILSTSWNIDGTRASMSLRGAFA